VSHGNPSQDNLIHGRFLAELTKEVFGDLESQKYTLTEYRISVYGRKREEWDGLAAWIFNNRLHSEQNVWLIQIPRLFQIYKAQGTMNNFQEMLDNIFIPLFEVSEEFLLLLSGHVGGLLAVYLQPYSLCSSSHQRVVELAPRSRGRGPGQQLSASAEEVERRESLVFRDSLDKSGRDALSLSPK